MAVHTHEEIAGVGVRHDEAHLTQVISQAAEMLRATGIEPCGYRGGHFAYLDFLTPFLEKIGLLMDFSSAPGFNQKRWDAVWVAAPMSAHYLCPVNHTAACCAMAPSKVLEIPLGTDGQGNANINYLYTEESTIEDLKRVWDSIVRRAEESCRPQIIHSLYHSSSMGIPEFKERFRQFVEYALGHGGVAVSPSEARSIFENLNA